MFSRIYDRIRLRFKANPRIFIIVGIAMLIAIEFIVLNLTNADSAKYKVCCKHGCLPADSYQTTPAGVTFYLKDKKRIIVGQYLLKEN